MKRCALVGFTRCDALVWLGFEARVRGCALMVHADGRATLDGGEYVILGPRDSISEIDRVLFDEIIDRKEIAA